MSCARPSGEVAELAAQEAVIIETDLDRSPVSRGNQRKCTLEAFMTSDGIEGFTDDYTDGVEWELPEHLSGGLNSKVIRRGGFRGDVIYAFQLSGGKETGNYK